MDIICPFDDCPASTDEREKAVHIVLHQYYPPPRSDIYRCKACGRTFSERRGTPYFNARLNRDKLGKLVGYLQTGRSIRATAREIGISRDTVRRYLRIYNSLESPEDFSLDKLDK